MKNVKRGEIYYADLSPVNRKPVQSHNDCDPTHFDTEEENTAYACHC